VVPFDKTRAVGKAYAAVKEHERAMQVYSGTADAYFLQEANVVGALEELGRSKPATEEMKRLLLDHPDSALNREMLFGLGLRLTSTGRALPAGGAKGPHQLGRLEMLAEAAALLERHLAWYPTDAAGDRVALTLGSAYLEAGRHAPAERTARAAAARYPKSRYLDGFDYSLAYALFAQKKFADALAMCDRLETFDYGAHANPGPAVMRERGILMKAQIFHAQGVLDRALENYKKVKETSPDAAWSVAFLEREAIAVPELSVAPLARPAEIELEYSGVAEAAVRAYKVDLTVLALRRKGIPDAASVEVAGIKPVFEKSFPLDAPNARRRERQKLALDLKAPGAYLVGVKAGGFFASGLLLRSDLAMAVQEGSEGTVRVNVTHAAAGGFAEGVKVTAFGTAGGPIAADKTDLRGVWETSGVKGLAIVVAEKDGHVALYRGQTALAAQPAQQVQRAAAEAGKQQQADVLDEQLRDANKEVEKFFLDNMIRQQKGVEVERTKR
jgi:tetratricopeptide (TPR) repeat protein